MVLAAKRRSGDAMQLRHIKALIAVADTGSLHTAAKRLGISQPSLTKTIREIESIVGVPLINRTVRGSLPNEFGQILLVRARAISEEFHRAKEEMDQLAGVSNGSVTVGLSPGAALLLSGVPIAQFMQANPGVCVHVREGLFDQLVTGVRQNRYDFSIGGLSNLETDGNVVVERLFENKIVPAVRHGHPLAGTTSFASLIKCDWALTNDEPTYIGLLSRHLETLGLSTPRILLRSESFSTILQLVPNTDLVVAMPQSLLMHPTVASVLVPIKVKDRCPSTNFALVRRAGIPLTPLAEQLARRMRKAAAAMASAQTSPVV